MNKADNAQQDPLLNWKTWWFWVVVCALEPVLYAVAAMAFGKPILQTDPHATLICFGIFALIAISLPMPGLLQWWVLRRVAPGLRLWGWILGMLAAWFIGFGLVPVVFGTIRIDQEFVVAAMHLRGYEAIQLTTIFQLPWSSLFLKIFVFAIALAFIPSLILARHSQQKWYFFLIAACGGACCSAVADQLYGFYFYRAIDQSLNGRDWLYRLNELGFRASVGAISGATTGAIFVALSQWSQISSRTAKNAQDRPTLRAMLISTLIIASLPPALFYSIGKDGLQSGFPMLRKALSSDPIADISKGENVLTYAQDAAFVPPLFPIVKFSPDSKSFVALDGSRTLQRIDVASGANLGQIGEPLGIHESHYLTWSPDGRYLVLRTDGDAVKQGTTPYSRHRSRLRIYGAPTYKMLNDITYRDKECFFSYGVSLMFELDGNSLWAACSQFYSSPKKADEIIAIRFDVPSMKILDVRPYGKNAEFPQVQELVRLGNDVGYWQPAQALSDTVFVRNLSRDEETTVLRNLTNLSLAGSLTKQSAEFEGEQITFRYCGNPSDVSDSGFVEKAPPAAVHSFCRNLVFDLRTGKPLKKLDFNKTQLATQLSQQSELSAVRQNLRILATWKQDGKSGEIVVQDIADNHERQHIVSQSQRPLAFSPDGRWLVMYAVDKKVLRIYRIAAGD